MLNNNVNEKELGVGEPVGVGGILAKLYRKIRMELGIGTTEFSRFLDSAASMYKYQKNSDVYRHFISSNLRSALHDKEMSFKVFFKGLVLLNIKGFKLKIELTDRLGRVTNHELVVDLKLEEYSNTKEGTNEKL